YASSPVLVHPLTLCWFSEALNQASEFPMLLGVRDQNDVAGRGSSGQGELAAVGGPGEGENLVGLKVGQLRGCAPIERVTPEVRDAIPSLHINQGLLIAGPLKGRV